MVLVTVDMMRKKAEHHDKQLAPLKEISLHQEGIEKLECIQDWCPKLEILLLQSNLISKIENINKLKELRYLNLAINNIEKVENIEKCESLQKLDLTLNFIGELTSIKSLKDNYNLKELYLNGNPCSDYEGYRTYVLAVLPQLHILDSVKIKKSERIKAMQEYSSILSYIYRQQEEYSIKREQQKVRLEKEITEKWRNEDDSVDDEEKTKRFWNETSEHSPEIRIEMERQTQLKKDLKNKPKIVSEKKVRPMFAPDGRPFNINQPHLPFIFDDGNPNEYILDLSIFRYLDTSLIDVDIQPFYVRVTIKEKIFQICLPEEVNMDKSTVKRSQITGHLVIKMPKMNCKIHKTDESQYKKFEKIPNETSENAEQNNNNSGRREYLEIGSSDNILDFTKMTKKSDETTRMLPVKSLFAKEKIPATDFVDNFDVPPLV